MKNQQKVCMCMLCMCEGVLYPFSTFQKNNFHIKMMEDEKQYPTQAI